MTTAPSFSHIIYPSYKHPSVRPPVCPLHFGFCWVGGCVGGGVGEGEKVFNKHCLLTFLVFTAYSSNKPKLQFLIFYMFFVSKHNLK